MTVILLYYKNGEHTTHGSSQSWLFRRPLPALIMHLQIAMPAMLSGALAWLFAPLLKACP
jgi:hypothetical protein